MRGEGVDSWGGGAVSTAPSWAVNALPLRYVARRCLLVVRALHELPKETSGSAGFYLPVPRSRERGRPTAGFHLAVCNPPSFAQSRRRLARGRHGSRTLALSKTPVSVLITGHPSSRWQMSMSMPVPACVSRSISVGEKDHHPGPRQNGPTDAVSDSAPRSRMAG